MDIWLSLSSLQFTDTFQVLYFLHCLYKIKASFCEKKKKEKKQRTLYTCVCVSVNYAKCINVFLYEKPGPVTSHVALRCSCYCRCAQVIYYLLYQSSSTQSQEKPLRLVQSRSLGCYSREYKSEKLDKNSNKKEFCA